ncbi:hypothetical protein [Flavihumibacter petaseus]|uniref:Lipoprotein n=1 Tax=Flavihumibacter petaseus NBRC 106054 TaxID=1220578 RepID=A0A0E9N3I7_9BACT|nr:hypothetical protein [Flavihumibacter petaseus]GAO44542.1 hypothetical protein FPE01S_03_05800 [Flavihumibacter petaseus NBRC 106054]
MKINPVAISVLAIFLLTLSSCLTANKVNNFVAVHYNNEFPEPGKKMKPEIEVSPAFTSDKSISTTVHKTDKFLPLLVYWKYDQRKNCSLNPSIPVINFSNAINSVATKRLTDKLNGRKLELIVEQAPAAFSLVIKENLIWLILAYSWSKIYIEPDFKDLVVSYKLMEADNTLKSGQITVKNINDIKGRRFFQSWKSATSEYLSEYNSNFTSMTKSFVDQLAEEL